MKNNDGYTLVELVIAIFILTLLTSMFVSIFASSARISGNNVASTLSKDKEISQVEEKMLTPAMADPDDTIKVYMSRGGVTIEESCRIIEASPDPSASPGPDVRRLRGFGAVATPSPTI